MLEVVPFLPHCMWCWTFSDCIIIFTTCRHSIDGKVVWQEGKEVTKHWAQCWSRCTGSQPAGYFLSHLPAVGCHYFQPGLRSPSQPKNVIVLRLVPSYTVWWQRHIGVNNLPKVATKWESNPRPNDRTSSLLPRRHCTTTFVWQCLTTVSGINMCIACVILQNDIE